MTGFGRSESQAGRVRVVVDVRSVNHRFLDVKMRLPQEAGAMEADLKKVLARSLSRGHVDLTLKLIRENGRPRIQVNKDLIKDCMKAVGAVQRELKIPGTVDAAMLLQVPGALKVESERSAELNRAERTAVQRSVAEAIAALCQVREREGAALQRDLERRLRTIRRRTKAIAKHSAGLSERLARKLHDRIRKLTQGVDLDPGRLAQEVAYLADRADITEELVRLQAHLDSMEGLLNGKKPRGKELDFLTQELHRETNTIHSKAGDLVIGREVLAIKSEIEKIREQVQNVE